MGLPASDYGSGKVSGGLAFSARRRACWGNQAPAAGSVKTVPVWRLQSGSEAWKLLLVLAGHPEMGGVYALSLQVLTPPARSHWPSDWPGVFTQR